MKIPDFIANIRDLMGVAKARSIKAIISDILKFDKTKNKYKQREFIERTIKTVSIHPQELAVGNFAFCGCIGLQFVFVPSSVTSIGNSAFNGCSSLADIYLEEQSALESIDYAAFRDCTSLSSITIPNSVTRINDSAFEHCNIHFIFECAEGEEPSGMPWRASSYTVEYLG